MNKLLNKKALEIRLDTRSKYLRKLIVQSLIGGGRGHMGSAMSLVEILRVLYDEFIKFNPKKPKSENRDRLILSKGHGCLALYAILADKKFIKRTDLDATSRFDSILGGHPESLKVPGIEVSTGALGHGFPIGVGMAIAAKLKKKKHNIYVVIGDGESNEGSIWEAALSASKHKLNNLKVMIDYNKIQSYDFVNKVLDLEPLKKK
jgi:transketolase